MASDAKQSLEPFASALEISFMVADQLSLSSMIHHCHRPLIIKSIFTFYAVTTSGAPPLVKKGHIALIIGDNFGECLWRHYSQQEKNSSGSQSLRTRKSIFATFLVLLYAGGDFLAIPPGTTFNPFHPTWDLDLSTLHIHWIVNFSKFCLFV